MYINITAQVLTSVGWHRSVPQGPQLVPEDVCDNDRLAVTAGHVEVSGG